MTEMLEMHLTPAIFQNYIKATLYSTACSTISYVLHSKIIILSLTVGQTTWGIKGAYKVNKTHRTVIILII